MTDNKIELPPLPTFSFVESVVAGSIRDYGRACYEAGLAAARAEQAQPAKSKVHSVVMKLQSDGSAWRATEKAWWTPSMVAATVTLRWTDDGSAWIESERNQELAARLRDTSFSLMNAAADALDGGVCDD